MGVYATARHGTGNGFSGRAQQLDLVIPKAARIRRSRS